jgi:hypothetical protein
VPVIFVHGVNTRKGPGYDAGVQVKTTFLKTCLKGAKINGKTFGAINTIDFPYWGDLATSFAWNMASLPRGEMQDLGGPTDAEIKVLLAHIRDALPQDMGSEPLVALAKRNFGNAVEMVCAMALDGTPTGMETDMAEFVVAAQGYAAANPNPPWLAATTTDFQFLGNLSQAVEGQANIQPQGFSKILTALNFVAAKLKSAAMGMAGKAVDKAGDFASTKLLSWTRESLNAQLGRFFGDIFIYFNTRGDKNAPGPIPKRILDALDAAADVVGEPLVIIGHSLGGVITFDLLGYCRPELQVDLFITVGSQVAHFEEIKLFKTSDPVIKGPAKAATPANIMHWINVYDEVDIFSYAAKAVFDRVDLDARYDTQTYVIKAHGAYFDQARFYQRLRDRINHLPP